MTWLEFSAAVVGSIAVVGAGVGPVWLQGRRLSKAIGRPANGYNVSAMVETVVRLSANNSVMLSRVDERVSALEGRVREMERPPDSGRTSGGRL